MNVLIKIAVAIVLSFVSYQSEAQEKHNITVTVKNAHSNDGKIFIALYKTESSFLKTAFKATKSEIKDNQCTITFEDIPEGIYAVSIFHDENNNGKLDSNFFGIPKEDYGCSNNAKGFMGPPKWDDANFQLIENKSISITL
ncbi:DUF2141 domain-containing protein [uncultured Winogradskyella sp.]|uniref:DUF2141 domain-containing protein n=1 Tax=uncultured Winogradskyella sp. TaxID=395353 RepID=UPI002630B173|nr:DUF2141 domain-containing protein [uncultured Winogradskyella sp.]